MPLCCHLRLSSPSSLPVAHLLPSPPSYSYLFPCSPVLCFRFPFPFAFACDHCNPLSKHQLSNNFTHARLYIVCPSLIAKAKFLIFCSSSILSKLMDTPNTLNFSCLGCRFNWSTISKSFNLSSISHGVPEAFNFNGYSQTEPKRSLSLISPTYRFLFHIIIRMEKK